MQIQLNRYRMADVEIHGGENLPDTGNCVQTASRMVRLFEPARAFDQARKRLTRSVSDSLTRDPTSPLRVGFSESVVPPWHTRPMA